MKNASLPDSLADALGRVVADVRRGFENDTKRGLELLEAQSRALLAEMAARRVSLEEEIRAAADARIDAAIAKILPAERGERGERGEAGPQGERGADGPPGEKGEQGEQGPPGERGADGRDGSDGAPGPAGVPGPQGERGADGVPGERGPEGPPGKLPIVQRWVDGVHYEGVVVSHNGATFQALRDTGREPPHEDWRCLATAGRDGADGRSFTVRGTWNAEAEYSALDVVALGGASFVARRDDPGVCPGEGWQLIATQGKQGKPGERGVQGPKGDPGKPGQPVVAASISSDGLLTLTNGDGSTVTCDFYPVLTRIVR